jgi:CarD family transcriptional regulator
MAKKELAFEPGDHIVYPSHGVGRVRSVETEIIAGFELEMYVVGFENERLTLRVPVGKAAKAGMRKLSSREKIQSALEALKIKTKPRRSVMWSRRAQEYEAKINSGDPVSIAEVVRDLYRGSDQPDQSYSERQIYQAALERLARELAAVEKIDEGKATERLEAVLTKTAA